MNEINPKPKLFIRNHNTSKSVRADPMGTGPSLIQRITVCTSPAPGHSSELKKQWEDFTEGDRVPNHAYHGHTLVSSIV